LPKIHKTLQKPPGRPIVSGVNGPTEKLSSLVDYWLQTSVQGVPSYIQDTTHMLRTLQEWNIQFGPFEPHVKLVTIDVVGLYTNIPHDDLRLALISKLGGQSNSDTPPIEMITKITDHVLQNNVFCVEGEFYQQIHGTAMGTPMAPSISILFMAWLEENMIRDSPVLIPDHFWKRFIDDILMLWTGTDDELDAFIKHINSYHSTIKFTVESSTTSIPFLDIKISLVDGFLQTDLYSKPTDTHSYLHYQSCHPSHVVKNIPYSQFLRLKRLCSDEEHFAERCNEMESHFSKRGYSASAVHDARQKVANMAREETLHYKPKTTSTRPPLVVTHHPLNPPFRKWLHELQDSVINTSERMSKVLPIPPVVGERNCHSLRRMLMPSVLPFPKDNKPGTCKCERKKCIICKEHLVQATTFKSQVTEEVFTIRDKMTCDTKNLIYLLFCDKCNNSQYVGETQNSLRTRFYLHRSDIKTKAGFLVSKHFNQPNHSLSNLKVIIIEKEYMDGKERRLCRENFWMTKLKTLTPLGLNTLDQGTKRPA
jgi:hypothetical protein